MSYFFQCMLHQCLLKNTEPKGSESGRGSCPRLWTVLQPSARQRTDRSEPWVLFCVAVMNLQRSDSIPRWLAGTWMKRQPPGRRRPPAWLSHPRSPVSLLPQSHGPASANEKEVVALERIQTAVQGQQIRSVQLMCTEAHCIHMSKQKKNHVISLIR